MAFHWAGSWTRDLTAIEGLPGRALGIGVSERAEWQRIHDRQQLQIDALLRAVEANSRMCHALLSGAQAGPGLNLNHLTSTPTHRSGEASVATTEPTDSTVTEARMEAEGAVRA